MAYRFYSNFIGDACEYSVLRTTKYATLFKQQTAKNAKISSPIIFFRLLTPALKANFITIAITKFVRLGKSLFRKRSDKMRKELEDAAREGSSRRSNSPVPSMPPNERTNSLSDLTGAAKAPGFYSDGLPKNIHMKFVRNYAIIYFIDPLKGDRSLI